MFANFIFLALVVAHEKFTDLPGFVCGSGNVLANVHALLRLAALFAD